MQRLFFGHRAILTACFLLSAMLVFGQGKKNVLEKVYALHGGPTTELAVEGNYLYAANGNSLVVYDIKEPIYKQMFSHRMRAQIQALRIRGGRLYIAAGSDGFSVWNIDNPIKPVKTGEWLPDESGIHVRDFSFSGDSIFVAAGHKAVILRQRAGIGASFDELGVFAEQLDGKGYVSAIDVKGSLIAVAVGGRKRGHGNGVHLYRRNDFSRINFHKQKKGAPSDLAFGETNSLLHIAGGEGLDSTGFYDIIDVANPAEPRLVYTDSIHGIADGLDVARVYNRHDLIFLVTGTGLSTAACKDTASHVYVYDATNPDSILKSSTIRGKALNRALDFKGDRLYVATGPGGPLALSLKLKDDHPCAPMVEQGKGEAQPPAWGADVFGEQVVVACGKAGIWKYNIQNDRLYLKQRYEVPGNCRNAKFNADGKFIVGFFECPGGDSIRVLETETMKEVGSLPGPYWHRKMHMWQNRFFVLREGNVGYDIFDISDPYAPKADAGVMVNLNDIGVDNKGRLIVTAEHTVKIIDVNEGQFKELTLLSKWGEGFGESTGWEDKFYIYTKKRGLICYELDKDGKSFILRELFNRKFKPVPPEEMAADKQGLYLGFKNYGIYSMDMETMDETGYYRNGLFDPTQPDRGFLELFCWANKIYLLEFYGQLTILQNLNAE